MSSAPSTTRTAWIALLGGVLCIGSSPIFVKLAHAPGLVSAFWRMAIAAFALSVASAWKRPPRPEGRWLGWILLGGTFFALDLALWNSSLLRVPVAVATPIANCAPVWVGVGGWILWNRRPSARFWAGFGACAVGMLLLAGAGMGRWNGDLGGAALSLGASVFYAAYLLGTSRARENCGTLPFMTLSTLSSLAVLGALCAATGQNLFHHPAATWGAFLGLGLVSHLAGWLLINHALGHLPPAPASVALLGQSVVAALLAIPILHELPDLRQDAGNVLVLAGIWWAARRAEPAG